MLLRRVFHTSAAAAMARGPRRVARSVTELRVKRKLLRCLPRLTAFDAITDAAERRHALLPLYEELIDMYAVGRRPQEAGVWLQAMKDKCGPPTVQAYTSCLEACHARAPDSVARAEVWFSDMRSSGLAPTLDSYRAMVRVYSVVNVPEASRWFARMLADPAVSADVSREDYLNMLRLCAHPTRGDPILYAHWARAIESVGGPLGDRLEDLSVLLTAVEMCAAHAASEPAIVAHSLVVRLQGQMSLRWHTPVLTRSAHHVLRALVAANDLAGADQWLRGMLAANLAFRPAAVAEFATACFTSEDPANRDRAYAWLRAISPWVLRLADADQRRLWLACPTPAAAAQLWDTAVGTSDSSGTVCVAPARAHSMHFEALVRLGAVPEALVALRALVQALADAGGETPAPGALPEPASRLLLETCLLDPKHDVAADAVYELLGDAIQQRLPPSVCAKLMLVYARRKTPRKAVFCLRQLMLSGQRPDRAVFNGMLAVYAVTGRIDITMATFQRMENDGIPADALAFEHLISVYARGGDVKTARAWAERMRARGLTPTPATVAVLLRDASALADQATAEKQSRST